MVAGEEAAGVRHPRDLATVRGQSRSPNRTGQRERVRELGHHPWLPRAANSQHATTNNSTSRAGTNRYRCSPRSRSVDHPIEHLVGERPRHDPQRHPVRPWCGPDRRNKGLLEKPDRAAAYAALIMTHVRLQPLPMNGLVEKSLRGSRAIHSRGCQNLSFVGWQFRLAACRWASPPAASCLENDGKYPP